MTNSDLKARTLTGALLTITAFVLLLLPEYFTVGGLFLQLSCLIIVTAASIELGIMHFQHRERLGMSLCFAICCILPALCMFLLSSLDYITAADSSHVVLCMRLGTFGFLAVILSAALIVYGGQGRIGTCGEVAQVGFPAISQIGIGGAALVALAGSPNSTRLLMLLLFTVCINDIAAYFGGRKFGGPKLAAVISPGKTISGALSGLVGGVVSGAILLQVMSPNGVSVLSIVILGSVVISAQLGDLNKSYLKRVYGVKDSSAILPGHGGIFDRIDGLLMGAPLLCFMASLLLPQ